LKKPTFRVEVCKRQCNRAAES